MNTNTKLILSGVCGAVLAVAAYAYAQAYFLADRAGSRVEAQQEVAPQAPVRPGEATCAAQHEERPGLSTWDLLAESYEIKAAVPGGVWLQKKKDVFFCNSGIIKDDETMCWKIRAPLRGLSCTDVLNRARSKEIRP